jgi:Ala-tRNA(Pro) deacylase
VGESPIAAFAFNQRLRTENMTILDLIRQHLNSLSIEFREIHHAPTFTSEESARARGEDLRIGGKALLIKTADVFRLFVLSASLKADSAAVREKFGVKKIRFATPAELKELTGLVPGSVPPFGPPILPFELYADTSVTSNEKIAFNAGSLEDSIILGVEDWLRAARPEVFRFGVSSDVH